MNILIKGMEMPQEPTPITLYPDGRWGDYTEGIFGTFVLIPTPYGRLIDADEMCKKIVRFRDMETDEAERYSDSKLLERAYGANEVIAILEQSPTIIEAEGGGEDG